jgi:hypothetical protein
MEYEEEVGSSHSFSKGAVAALVAIWIIGGALGGYAIHEHRVAQSLNTQNQQTVQELSATRTQLGELSAKVNELTARVQAQPTANAQAQSDAAAPAPNPPRRHAATTRHTEPSRWKKMQSQLDAQNKAIEETQTQLATTQGNLDSTRTELTGSIARTHDELVLLEKKGERSYYEFDLYRSKQFQRTGPFSIRLRKANTKHQYADLELLVDDRNLSQKHVNLYQPVMFYTPDSPQAADVVINSIGKDHIHGYVSAPRYRQSELASMSNANATTTAVSSASASDTTSVPRQKLPAPQ